MKKSPFYQMFLDILKEIYDAEHQIVQALPQLIQMASHGDLKDSLSKHLDETRNQVQRLNKVFNILGETPERVPYKPLQALIEEGQKIDQRNYGPAVRDACLIIGAQQIEHLEMAVYGSLCSLAEQLNDSDFEDDIDFDKVVDLLDESLDEESSADKKLTRVAEGGLFNDGINEEAEKEATIRRR